MCGEGGRGVPPPLARRCCELAVVVGVAAPRVAAARVCCGWVADAAPGAPQ